MTLANAQPLEASVLIDAGSLLTTSA